MKIEYEQQHQAASQSERRHTTNSVNSASAEQSSSQSISCDLVSADSAVVMLQIQSPCLHPPHQITDHCELW